MAQLERQLVFRYKCLNWAKWLIQFDDVVTNVSLKYVGCMSTGILQGNIIRFQDTLQVLRLKGDSCSSEIIDFWGFK